MWSEVAAAKHSGELVVISWQRARVRTTGLDQYRTTHLSTSTSTHSGTKKPRHEAVDSLSKNNRELFPLEINNKLCVHSLQYYKLIAPPSQRGSWPQPRWAMVPTSRGQGGMFGSYKTGRGPTFLRCKRNGAQMACSGWGPI